MEQHDNGPVLPSTFIRDAYQVLALAWAMARVYTTSSALYQRLKQTLKRITK
jgi:hypothetical protein